MNTLLFSACGLSFLSFLKSSKEKQTPAALLKETVWIFAGICLFAGFCFSLRVFSGFQILEIQILAAVVFYALTLALRQGIQIFTAIAGLSFQVLEYASSWSGAAAGILAAAFLYAAFRFALRAFQGRSVFYKPAPLFAGYPFLMVQAFWVSVILTVFCLVLSRTGF